ncbi:MAG: hypothetical protein M3N82_02840 [Pseudomonadota bacterium]|nr:hypothetical protein [Pseudomonadota bacterium]
MFIDSLALEPAYGGLLLLYLVAMRRMAGRHRAQKWDLPLQIACLLVASAVAFDLAENGMTVRAAEDGLLQMLAQPTVDDVHLATQFKWGFIGAAMLAVALFLRPVTRIHASVWLVAGLWFAVADVPFAAVQSARLNLGETLNATCQIAVGLLFFLALLSIGVGLWLVGEQAARQPPGEHSN